MDSPQEIQEFHQRLDLILEGIAPFPQSSESISELIQGLKSVDPVLRLKIVQVFRQGGLLALPPLVEALQSEDVELRRAVVTALGALGPAAQEAIPALKHALQDEAVAPEAAEAIQKITRPISLIRQVDQYLGGVVPIFLVLGIVLTLVSLLYFLFREAGQIVVDMAVSFCVIGGSLGGILGGSRWGRRGAVLSALVLALGGALVGVGIGYVAGSILGPVIQSLELKKKF